MKILLEVHTENQTEVNNAIAFLKTFQLPVTIQPSLLDHREITDSGDGVTDKQYWFLKHNTELTDDQVAKLTRAEAGEIIYKTKQKQTEDATKIFTSAAPGNSEPVPWEQENKKMCEAIECDKEAVARGLCSKHYQREYKDRKEVKTQ